MTEERAPYRDQPASDTPRTDAASMRKPSDTADIVLADFARQLERELAVARIAAQNAEGMAECMRMFRDDMIEAGVITAAVAPMFMTEAILAVVLGYRADADKWRELMTVLNSPELRPLVVSFKAMIDYELKGHNADITGR